MYCDDSDYKSVRGSGRKKMRNDIYQGGLVHVGVGGECMIVWLPSPVAVCLPSPDAVEVVLA